MLERRRVPVVRTWEPLDKMERMMDEMLRAWPLRARWRRAPAGELAWAPPVEMYEKEDRYIVRADLPGVKREDIDISVAGDTLTIRGERKALEEVDNEEYHRCEVFY